MVAIGKILLLHYFYFLNDLLVIRSFSVTFISCICGVWAFSVVYHMLETFLTSLNDEKTDAKY